MSYRSFAKCGFIGTTMVHGLLVELAELQTQNEYFPIGGKMHGIIALSLAGENIQVDRLVLCLLNYDDRFNAH